MLREAMSSKVQELVVNVEEHGWRRAVVVLTVSLAVLLQLADTTIVNVSLPTIDGALGASTDEGTWLVTAYIIANVIVIPLSPWLQTRFGRRAYFVTSIAGFTILSAFCGLADSLQTEIVLRFIQGAFGGGLLLPAQQILRDTFGPRELGKSQAIFGLLVPVGPTIGPILGGWLTDSYSWQWVFFVNVLPGMLAAALALVFLRNPERPRKLTVDALGIVLLAIGLGSLQYVLERGERLDWFSDPGIVAFTVLALAGCAAFLWWELRGATTPIVNLKVMGDRAVWAGTLTFFAMGFAFYGMYILQPVYTQQTLQLTTTWSGYFVAIRALALMATYPIVNWLLGKPKVDMRFVVAISSVMYGLVWLWQANEMTTTADFDAFVLSQAIGGVFLGLLYMPFNVVLMRAVNPTSVAASLGLVRLGPQIGGSVGSALIVTVMNRSFDQNADALRAGIGLARPVVSRFVAEHGSIAPALLLNMTSAQATALAQADGARFLGVIILLSSPLVLLIRRHTNATLDAAEQRDSNVRKASIVRLAPPTSPIEAKP
jgi:MFS transporter, DHA2 family, multidrug resistance protein